MTFTNQTARTSATGTNTPGQEIPYSFPTNANTDLVVITRITTTGVEVTLALTTDYTATVSSTGGTVTMVAAIPVTKTIHVIRDTPNTQSLDLVAGGSFDAENVEDVLDKVTKLSIENKDALTRMLRFPATDPVAAVPDMDNSIDRKGKYLFFDDSTGAPVAANQADVSAINVSAFAETYLNDPNARATMATIDGRVVINVQKHGAVGDGVADDTAAIVAAIAESEAREVVNTMVTPGGTIESISRPPLFFPEGTYQVTSALTPNTNNAVQYLEVFGNHASLNISAGVTAFGGVGIECYFHDLTFHGGAQAISIKTANLNTSKITVDNCTFVNQTVNCIVADDGSNSTLLNISNCKFLENNTVGTHILDTGSMDIVNMNNCWSSGSPAIAIESSGGRLNLIGCQFFPRGITAWVNQSGAALRFNHCILSGEDGGGCFVNYRKTGGTLQIENCTLFSNDAAVRFYGMPKSFKWNNNIGTLGTESEGGANTGGFWFSPDISQGDIDDIWNDDSRYLLDGFVPFSTGDAELADITTALQVEIDQPPSQPLDTDLKLVLAVTEGGFGMNTSTLRVTESAPVYEPIFGIRSRSLEADAGGNSIFNRRWTSALNGFDVGNYTYVRFIRVMNESTIRLQIRAGERSSTIRDFGQGYHVVCMPFHFEANETVGMVVSNFREGDIVWLGPIRIYAGYHVINTINDVRYGDTIPTTLQHYVGDRVINSAPAASGNTGWVCVAAGEPGVWLPFGGIDQLTLLSTTTVPLNADGDTTIFTVPTGLRCILDHAKLVAGADASTSDISIGQNGAETDFVGVTNLDNLDAANDIVLLAPVPSATPATLKSYAAATVIQAQVANQAGGATNTLYLYGTLY